MTTTVDEPVVGRLGRAGDEAATTRITIVTDEVATTRMALLRAVPAPSTVPARALPAAASPVPALRTRRYDRATIDPAARRGKRRAFALATAGTMLVLIAVRSAIYLSWGQATGLDIGNWLTLGHAWLGDPVTGSSSTYPPVVPVLAAALTEVLPLQYTAALLGALGTAALGAGTAAVLWRGGVGWWSLPLALVVASGSAVGEALTWGGFPQVISLGLGMVALHLVGELLVTPRPRPAWLLGAVLLALGATSHLILAIVVAAAGLMVLLRLTWAVPRPTWAGVGYLVGIWVRVGLPCLILTPLYLRLLTTVGASVADRAETQTVADLLQAIDGVIREAPLLWRPAVVFSLLLPVLLWRERHRPLWQVTASLALLIGGLAAVSPEPRFAYVVPLMVATAFGLLAATGPVFTRATARGVGAAALLLAVTVTTVQALAMFPAQVRYYGSLIPAGTQSALDDLRAATTEDDVVLVPPVRGVPFGWWVEGYGRRETYVGSSSLWLNFGAERQRAEESVRLFSQADVLSDRWFAAAAQAGIDVVYIPANYDGVSDDVREIARVMNADRVLHTSPAALILQVD